MGRELALQLAKRGCKVAVVGRRLDRLQELAKNPMILPFQHDVTKYDEVPVLFQEVCKALGGLDLIIYASGVMADVGPYEFEFEKDREMIEVNVLGGIAWLNQAAIRFSNVGEGTIVGIGSVAGDRGRVGQPVYNASKAALATYLEALRNRLWKEGVTVVTVKPGPVQTEMTERLKLKKALPADKAAAIILKKAEKSGEHYLMLPHRIIFAGIRNTPSFLFRRLKI